MHPAEVQAVAVACAAAAGGGLGAEATQTADETPRCQARAIAHGEEETFARKGSPGAGCCPPAQKEGEREKDRGKDRAKTTQAQIDARGRPRVVRRNLAILVFAAVFPCRCPSFLSLRPSNGSHSSGSHALGCTPSGCTPLSRTHHPSLLLFFFFSFFFSGGRSANHPMIALPPAFPGLHSACSSRQPWPVRPDPRLLGRWSSAVSTR